MRFIFRWAFRLFLMAAVLAVALLLLKDALLKAIAENQIRSQTGLDAKIERLELSLLSPTLTLENFKLYNTAEFGGSPVVDLPELHLEWDPSALMRRNLHFRLVRLDLKELNVVENKEGRTNIVGFVTELQKLSSTNVDEPLIAGLKFSGIDMLNLTLGKMKYSNLKQPGKDYEFAFGLQNEILTQIKTLPELSDLVLKTFFNRGITITSRGDKMSVTVNPKSDLRSPINKTKPSTRRAPSDSSRPK